MADEIKRILVTGSSGFIGSNLMRHLLTRGYSMRGIDIAEPKLSDLRDCWVRGDIMDEAWIIGQFKDFAPTHVVHLAARTDLGHGDSLDGFKVNTVGVQNVINACKTVPCLKAATFASTILVCHTGYIPNSDIDYCPSTPYGESKKVGEDILRAAGKKLDFAWSIVRPTSIWGPGYGSHYLDFFRTIAKGRYFHPGNANSLTVYGYVGNCVFQIERLIMANPTSVLGRVFYLGDYEPTRLKDWAELIHQQMGRGPVRVLPDCLIRLAALCGDALFACGWKKVPLTSFRLRNMATNRLYDIAPIRDLVGVLPYTQLEAVKETIEWLKEHEGI